MIGSSSYFILKQQPRLQQITETTSNIFMPMGRYLCQLCWSIVHYGERHPCFFYKNDDEVYTVPPPNEPEEVEIEETPTGNLNDNKGNPFAVAEQSNIEGSNETTSLPFDNKKQISVMTASRRKRSHLSLMPSKFIRGTKIGPSESKSASSHIAKRDGIKVAAKKSKNPRKIESASAVVPHVGNHSTSEMAPKSVAVGSASEAGTSGIQTQPHETEDEKRFVCDVCGRAFHTRQQSEIHMRTHTGDRPFVCSTCGRGFTQQGHLTNHRLTHTGEKNFDCEFCGNRFARKDHLAVHLVLHTGEKPFQCKFCDACFTHQSSCINHQKRKHGGM